MRLSRRLVRRLVRGRRILLNRRPAYLARATRTGDVISARVSEPRRHGGALEPVEMPLVIAYEDDSILVVEKPAGVLVHPTSPHHRSTLAHGIAHHYSRLRADAIVRPVHRLDRDTSGLILIAKTAVSHQRLDRQLRNGGLTREYLALVQGIVREDTVTIDAPIGRSRSDPTLRAVRTHGRPARTRFEIVERHADCALVRLDLETGRTHQIRVHLAHIGHPVLGDTRYGARPIPGLRRAALHSSRLVFKHPVTRQLLDLTSPLPSDIADLIAAGRDDAGNRADAESTVGDADDESGGEGAQAI